MKKLSTVTLSFLFIVATTPARANLISREDMLAVTGTVATCVGLWSLYRSVNPKRRKGIVVSATERWAAGLFGVTAFVGGMSLTLQSQDLPRAFDRRELFWQ